MTRSRHDVAPPAAHVILSTTLPTPTRLHSATESCPMLTVLGSRSRYCDGLSRRSFLKVGALGVGGLTLPQLLRAEAASGKKSHKSVIMVYLSGGMAHQDTFDLKPNGPAELKGEFKPIPTNVTGIQFG